MSAARPGFPTTVYAAVVGSAAAAELDAFAHERLAPPKRPQEYHRLDDLPRTLTRRVRRDRLSPRSDGGTAAG